MQHVLIVEDEAKLAKLQQEFLEKSGFNVSILMDGNPVIDWVKTHSPDLILLDLMLPGKDGLTLCREIRQFSDVPIIMLTAKVEEIDRILGLELGADDYVCKPVSPSEVVARVRANLRRSGITQQSEHTEASTDVNTSPLQWDEAKYSVSLNGEPLNLTAIEFQLLLTLAKQPGRIFTRDQLMENIYSDSRIVSNRTIDSHVKKIRTKLKAIDADNEYIHSLYGVGFKFETSDDER
ncbi:response regulator [Marinibactrum halimedae]|uniref:DNA-binding response regulator n=1 Tax=Marinibactrum halimedae TaxID=1444977 RepID=A0AA37T854_9GAMM|nr:response regulator [Marinibactrum halimedae]MCD9461107.1 response regulator [Marinibactrum halimedae]GLS24447.1 DNA-binding response regulator [Marinibactrum halimedae]